MKHREFNCPSGSKPTGAERLSCSLSICSFRIFLMLLAAIPIADLAFAQTKTRLSIATGGTGGVYYPLGGGMAALISRNIPGTEATAEVTTASVDNMKLIHTGRVALALTLPDTAWDARRKTKRP
jgi:TRAP-type uncharacterized transport system substrate-binding protein